MWLDVRWVLVGQGSRGGMWDAGGRAWALQKGRSVAALALWLQGLSPSRCPLPSHSPSNPAARPQSAAQPCAGAPSPQTRLCAGTGVVRSTIPAAALCTVPVSGQDASVRSPGLSLTPGGLGSPWRAAGSVHLRGEGMLGGPGSPLTQQLPHLLAVPAALSVHQSSELCCRSRMRRSRGFSPSAGTGLSLSGWSTTRVPAASFAELTLGLRSTPIRITAIPSSTGGICSISTSSNVIKVSAQGPGCGVGAAPCVGAGTAIGGLCCVGKGTPRACV